MLYITYDSYRNMYSITPTKVQWDGVLSDTPVPHARTDSARECGAHRTHARDWARAIPAYARTPLASHGPIHLPLSGTGPRPVVWRGRFTFDAPRRDSCADTMPNPSESAGERSRAARAKRGFEIKDGSGRGVRIEMRYAEHTSSVAATGAGMPQRDVALAEGAAVRA